MRHNLMIAAIPAREFAHSVHKAEPAHLNQEVQRGGCSTPEPSAAPVPHSVADRQRIVVDKPILVTDAPHVVRFMFEQVIQNRDLLCARYLLSAHSAQLSHPRFRLMRPLIIASCLMSSQQQGSTMQSCLRCLLLRFQYRQYSHEVSSAWYSNLFRFRVYCDIMPSISFDFTRKKPELSNGKLGLMLFNFSFCLNRYLRC